MVIFDFKEYREYLLKYIEGLPSKGRGHKKFLSEKLRISTVAMTHIFNGKNSLTLDQGLVISEEYGHTELERQYFFTLIELDRAKTHHLKKYLESKLVEISQKAKDLKNRVGKHDDLDDAAKSIFYSDWLYSGIRMLVGLKEFNSIEDIARYFDLSRSRVSEIVDFLLKFGLVEEKDGRLQRGKFNTHLSKNSPYINSHRRNWRLKGIEKLKEVEESDVFYSGPMVISEDGAYWLREEISQLLSRFTKKVSKTEAEIPMVLNIDLFKF